jgi:pyridoxal phosphate enzyme (YggS family)
MSIAGRLALVRSRIDGAATAAGRAPASIRLIAVSKFFPLSAILEAFAAGQRDFGENRVQEALEKIEGLQKTALPADAPIRWHLLGHLQSNKAKRAASAFAVVQSVDSVDLLQKLDAAAASAGVRPELLLQVDLAGEATKHGVPSGEARRLLDVADGCRAAQVVGLMTLPPVPDVPEDARPWFRQLRELRDAWLAAGVPAAMLRELSMGMSGDFEVAIAEGATMVRVGTAIFGERPAP